MSTILKALQRLEDEKSARVERTLDEQVAARPPVPGPRRWLLVALALLGGVVAGSSALFVLRGLDASDTSDTSAAAVKPSAASAPAVAAAPPARPLPRVGSAPPRPEPERSVPAWSDSAADAEAASDDVATVKRVEPRRLDHSEIARPGLRTPAGLNTEDTAVALEAVRAALEAANENLQAARDGKPRRLADAQPARSSAPPLTSSASPERSSASTRATISPLAPMASPSGVESGPPPDARDVAASAVEAPVAPIPEVQAKPDVPAKRPVAAEPARPAKVLPPRPGAAALAKRARVAAPPTVVAVAEPAVAAAETAVAGGAESRTVVRAAPPTVFVESTMWHPTPGRRSAMVEVAGDGGPIQVHEGDAIGTLVVVEIQPTGVFFDHEGVELRRRVGRH